MVQSQLILQCQGPVHCRTSPQAQWPWSQLGRRWGILVRCIWYATLHAAKMINVFSTSIRCLRKSENISLIHVVMATKSGIRWTHMDPHGAPLSHPTSHLDSWSDALGTESGKSKHWGAGRSCLVRKENGWLGKPSDFLLLERWHGRIGNFSGWEPVYPRLLKTRLQVMNKVKLFCLFARLPGSGRNASAAIAISSGWNMLNLTREFSSAGVVKLRDL